MMRACIAAAALLALAACGEKPQSMGTVKQDTTAFSGTGMPYVAQGWKPGASTAKNGCGWNQSGPRRGSFGSEPGPSIT